MHHYLTQKRRFLLMTNVQNYILRYHRWKKREPRSVGSYPRAEYWFGNMWANRLVTTFEGGNWTKDFRMRGETFAKLVQLLAPYLTKEY